MGYRHYLVQTCGYVGGGARKKIATSLFDWFLRLALERTMILLSDFTIASTDRTKYNLLEWSLRHFIGCLARFETFHRLFQIDHILLGKISP